MTHTDQQLKQALAKMLPDTLIWWNGFLGYKTDELYKRDVYDTELLHLCWLVEETLVPGTMRWMDYMDSMNDAVLPHSLIHATWQQRTIALCKVKEVEIV